MKFSHATTLLVISSASTVSAFQSASPFGARPTTNAFSTRQLAVAVDLPDNSMVVSPSTDATDVEQPFDMTGIAMSGLQGKALKWKESDFPKAKDLRAVIPKDCFEAETKTSLKYLSVSVIGTTLCSFFGARMVSTFNPASLINLPFWSAYSAVTGTVAMGLWVLAHECGHGAFSKNKKTSKHSRVLIAFPLFGSLLQLATIARRSPPIHQPHGIGRDPRARNRCR